MKIRRAMVACMLLTTLALPLSTPRPALGAAPRAPLTVILRAQTPRDMPIYVTFAFHAQGHQRFVPVDVTVVVRDQRPDRRPQGLTTVPVMGNVFVVYLGCQSLCVTATGGALAHSSDVTAHAISETRTPLYGGPARPFQGYCVEPDYLSHQPIIGAGGSPTFLGQSVYTMRLRLHVFWHAYLRHGGLSGVVTVRPIVYVRTFEGAIICPGIGSRIP